MATIVAIESDPGRRRVLADLVRERVKARIMIVGSVKAAIPLVTEHLPDVILVPPLLSAQDHARLTAHVKQLPAASHVQMLTIAALDTLADAPRMEGRGLFTRRPARLLGQYDPGWVAARIADGLAYAGALRAEGAAVPVDAEPLVAAISPRLAPVPALVGHDRDRFMRRGQEEEERRRARRSAPGDLPWLSGVRLPWGLELHLVNISSSGLLVESGSKLTVGITYDLHLNGPETSRIVKARLVRSEVARIDARGVRYFAAARFEGDLDLLARREHTPEATTPQEAIGALVADVLAEPHQPGEPARVRFARGLRRLVRARDVLVRSDPVAPADGSESIYFHVTGRGASRTILQVVFDRDRELTALEFGLLKAGASFTAAILELEKPLAGAAQESPPLVAYAR